MAIGKLCYLNAARYKAEKALVAAMFNGIELDEKAMAAGECATLPGNPANKVPCLLLDEGCIFGSVAVARYVASCRGDTKLYGKTFDDKGLIDTWLDFGTYELEVPLMTWVYPTMGIMENHPESVQRAQEDVKRALNAMETQLKSTQYLVGDCVTLADVCLVCSLKEAFVHVFDSAFRKGFPKVSVWFEACAAMPQFKKAFGDLKLCQVADKPKPVAAPISTKEGKGSPKSSPKGQSAKAKTEGRASPKSSPKTKPLAAPPVQAAPPGGVDEAAIKACGDEIRVLKEKLKGEGLSGGKINNHADIKALVEKLTQLKTGAGAAAAPAPVATPAEKKEAPRASPKKSPKAAPAAAAPAAGGGVDEAAIKACGDEIRVLKEKLKADGLSGKKINDHAEVKALVEKLTGLKAGGAAPAAAPAAAAAPVAAAPAGDADAEITAVGDEIRKLKEKLKADGLSGKKVNDHAEVKALVAKLQELKAKK